MAETVKIGDIAKQLSTASRLVVSTDFFWVYMADGQQVKIPAEFVRAYLTDSLKPSVDADGNWSIGGESTGVKAQGVTPQLRSTSEGIEVSYDGGSTWSVLALYTDMSPVVSDLVAAYESITKTEQSRVDAETARAEAETSRSEAEAARVEAEQARATAETQRESDFSEAKTACEDATANADTATTNANTATKNANDAADRVDAAILDISTEKQAALDAADKANTAATNANTEAQKASDTNSSIATAEASRVKAESSRMDAEIARSKAESSRATAETQRQTDTATALANIQKSIESADDTANHPTKVGEDHYIYTWDKTAQAYTKTSIYVKGEKGDKGDQGIQGEKGATGDNGKSPYVKDGDWWIYDDATGKFVDSGVAVSSSYVLTKEKIENQLTGDITSHTHSQYALDTSLTSEVNRATEVEEALQAVIDTINGSSETEGSFRKAIADLIGGAPESLDTLKEIADKLSSDDDLHKTITEAIAKKADKATSLSGYGITDGYTKTQVDTLLSGYLKSSDGKAADSDKLDGVHLAEIFTSLANDTDDNTVKMVIGGVTKALVVAYASKASQADNATNAGAVAWDGVSGKPSTFTPSSHSHAASEITSGTLAVARGGTGKTSLLDACNALINALSTGSATPQDSDYYVSQYAGGGTSTTTFHRRPMSALYSYVKAKLDSVYQPKGSYLTAHQDISGKADKATTLAGYGITDANISDGKITLGANSITPLTAHQDLSAYAKTSAIPTKMSQLTNDSGYTTQSWVTSQGYTKGTIPTKTSELTNDSGYITEDDLKETINISLASNQSSDSSINGATITVSSGSSTLGTYTWNGTAIAVKVSGGMSVSVSVSGVTGYKTPATQTFTTVMGNSRNVTMTYQTEVVTVTVGSSNSASMNGQVITVNGTNYTYSGSFSVKVPFGTSYSVSANAKDMYSTPATQTFTASQATRAVTLTYTYMPLGVYILDTDGNLTTADNWNTANNSKAVGVAVLTDNCRFVIAPANASSSALQWSSNTEGTLSGIVETTNESTAKKDYAGQANTAIMLKASSSTSYAAGACNAYTFKNGKKGYLWSLGEVWTAYQNRSAINTAMSKMGGTALSSYYWTSTQYSTSWDDDDSCYYSDAWYLDWSYGDVSYDRKRYGNYVRAVCAF